MNQEEIMVGGDIVNIQSITDKLILVGVEVRCLSGTVSRDDHDPNDKDAFTTGSVRYIRKGALDPYTAARQAAARACRARGARLLGGWAVPVESLKDLATDLQSIAEFINDRKKPLIENWQAELAKWQEDHPSVSKYAGKFPSAHAAEKGIGIAISMLRVNPEPVKIPGVIDSTTEQVRSLPMKILWEIANDIQDSWKPGGLKAKETIKALLKRIVSKCQSLAFVGGNLAEVASFVQTAINRLPPSGDIVGNDFLMLSGLLSLLSNPETVAKGNLMETLTLRQSIAAAPHPAAEPQGEAKDMTKPSRGKKATTKQEAKASPAEAPVVPAEKPAAAPVEIPNGMPLTLAALESATASFAW